MLLIEIRLLKILINLLTMFHLLQCSTWCDRHMARFQKTVKSFRCLSGQDNLIKKSCKHCTKKRFYQTRVLTHKRKNYAYTNKIFTRASLFYISIYRTRVFQRAYFCAEQSINTRIFQPFIKRLLFVVLRHKVAWCSGYATETFNLGAVLTKTKTKLLHKRKHFCNQFLGLQYCLEFFLKNF